MGEVAEEEAWMAKGEVMKCLMREAKKITHCQNKN